MLEVAGRGIRTKCGKHTETVGACQGELRVGLCWALTQTVPDLAGEVGCVRGWPFLVWGGRTEQEDFLKKKKTLRDTVGNSPAAAAPVSSLPGCLVLPQGCEGYRAQILSTRGRVHTRLRRQAPTGESATQRDMRPKAPGRVQIKEGPVHAHP